MLISEFITRTGYQPTADEYAEIEREYMHSSSDKDAFCRAWKRVNPTKAGQIERARKKAERTEKVFQIALKEVRKYKGDDPWADTSLFDVYDIMDRKRVTAEELATACNKLYECGHTFGLDCNQFNRARLLRNYAKKAQINE